jgi:hypothetical protein
VGEHEISHNVWDAEVDDDEDDDDEDDVEVEEEEEDDGIGLPNADRISVDGQIDCQY